MADETRNDDMLEALFADARADKDAQPTPDFMARVLLDAETHMPQAPAIAPPRVRVGFFRQLATSLGGWKSVSGLTAAMVAGVWIGFSSMSVLTDGLDGLLGNDSQYYLVDLELGFAFESSEG